MTKDEDWTREIRARLEAYANSDGGVWYDEPTREERAFLKSAPTDIARLLEEREVLREALSNVRCKCTIQQMMSGHKTDCYMPQIEEALAYLPKEMREK